MVTSCRGNSFMEVFFAHLKCEDGLKAFGDVVVINEFVDVFGDIHRLPPIRKIKFDIDLVLGITLIH